MAVIQHDDVRALVHDCCLVAVTELDEGAGLWDAVGDVRRMTASAV